MAHEFLLTRGDICANILSKMKKKKLKRSGPDRKAFTLGPTVSNHTPSIEEVMQAVEKIAQEKSVSTAEFLEGRGRGRVHLPTLFEEMYLEFPLIGSEEYAEYLAKVLNAYGRTLPLQELENCRNLLGPIIRSLFYAAGKLFNPHALFGVFALLGTLTGSLLGNPLFRHLRRNDQDFWMFFATLLHNQIYVIRVETHPHTVKEWERFSKFLLAIRPFQVTEGEYIQLQQKVYQQLQTTSQALPEQFFLDLSAIDPVLRKVEVRIDKDTPIVISRSPEAENKWRLDIAVPDKSKLKEYDKSKLTEYSDWLMTLSPETIELAELVNLYRIVVAADDKDSYTIPYLALLAVDDLLTERETVISTIKTIQRTLPTGTKATMVRSHNPIIQAPRKRYIRDYHQRTIRVRSGIPKTRYLRRHTVAACIVRVPMSPKSRTHWESLAAKGIYPIDNKGQRIPLPADNSYTIRVGHERGGEQAAAKEQVLPVLPQVVSQQVKWALKESRRKNCMICDEVGQSFIKSRCPKCHIEYLDFLGV